MSTVPNDPRIPMTEAEVHDLLTVCLHGPLPQPTVQRMMATLSVWLYDRQQLPTRAYPADEVTRDPIFLLERRQWVCRDVAHYRYDSDAEVMRDPDGVEVDAAFKAASEDFEEVWEVESVWFTREEAEGFAKRTEYRRQYGWRVYCLCAEGKLAQILDSRTSR